MSRARRAGPVQDAPRDRAGRRLVGFEDVDLPAAVANRANERSHT